MNKPLVCRSGMREDLCSKCGSPLLPDALFCHRCGTRQGAGTCSCGQMLPPGASFCPHCGATTKPREAASSPSPPSHLELRPVTALFVDIVGSTSLAERLGPEQFREVLVRFRSEIEPIIEAHGGFVAQYAGDSVLAFFGYPEAHANDARSAVEAALKLVARTRSRRTDDPQNPFLVRVGCHSGPVIVDPSPTSNVASAPAEGLVIALASRVQLEAPPNSIVVTTQTHTLVEEFFTCRPLGYRSLKGIAAPVALFEVLERRTNGETRAFRGPRQRVPFVSREREIAALQAEWERCDSALGRAVVLSGEAGVGKSRLVWEFCRQLEDAEAPCIIANCDEGHQTTPFALFASLLADDLKGHSTGPASTDQQLEARLAELGLDADIANGLKPLLETQGATSAQSNDPVSLMRRIRMSVLTYVHALMGDRGLLVIEDIQWCDASSRQILSRLLAEGPRPGTLIVLTCRPGEAEFDTLLRGVSVFSVSPFDDAQTRQIIEALDKKNELSESRIAALVRLCDGNPLYIEECTRALIAEHSLDFGSIESIPDRLHGIIWHRLDRLGRLKWLAQVAALIGHRFDLTILQRVAARIADIGRSADEIEDDIAELERAALIVAASSKPGGQLSFRHALVREAAYQSLPISLRRQWHQVVATVIAEACEQGIADVPTESIARHWSAADRPDEAAPKFLQAGKDACRRFANVEALSLFQAALAETERIQPATARPAIEVSTRLAMNAPIIAHVGWASDALESNNLRVLTVARSDESLADVFYSRRMLFNVALLRADAANVEAHLSGLRAIAGQVPDGEMVLDRCEGAKLMFVDGDVAPAQAALVRSLIGFDPDRHRVGAKLFDLDGEVAVKSLCSWLLWFAGKPDSARSLALETIALAHTIQHPFSLAYALCLGGSALLSAGDVETVREIAVEAQRLADQYYMDYWAAYANVLAAGAKISTDPVSAAADLEAAGKSYRATGARLIVPWICALEADARRRTGETERSNRLLAVTTNASFGLFRLNVEPIAG